MKRRTTSRIDFEPHVRRLQDESKELLSISPKQELLENDFFNKIAITGDDGGGNTAPGLSLCSPKNEHNDVVVPAVDSFNPAAAIKIAEPQGVLEISRRARIDYLLNEGLLPKLKLEYYIAERKNKILESSIYPPIVELILAYEAHDLKVSPEELEQFVEKFYHLVDELKELRLTEGGDMIVLKKLLRLVYSDTAYDYGNNAMLSYFDTSQAGNCVARQKFIAAVLESMGYNPDTEIAVQTFKLHSRNLLKLNGQWQVIEGDQPFPLKPEDRLGTPIFPLTDMKRAFVGLPPEHIEFQPLPAMVPAQGLDAQLATLKQSVERSLNQRSQRKVKDINYNDFPEPQQTYGSMTNSLLVSYLSQGKQKAIMATTAVVGVALLFYGGFKLEQHPEIKTMADFSRAVESDGDSIRGIARQVVEAVIAKTTPIQPVDAITENWSDITLITEKALQERLAQEQIEQRNSVTVDDLRTLKDIAISIDKVDNNPNSRANLHVLTPEITLHVNKTGAIRFTAEALCSLLSTKELIDRLHIPIVLQDISLIDDININIQSSTLQLTEEDIKAIIRNAPDLSVFSPTLQHVKLNGQVILNVAQFLDEAKDEAFVRRPPGVSVELFKNATQSIKMENGRTRLDVSFNSKMNIVTAEVWNYIYSTAAYELSIWYPGQFTTGERTTGGMGLEELKPFDVNIIGENIQFSAADIQSVFEQNKNNLGVENIRVKLNGQVIFDPVDWEKLNASLKKFSKIP